MPEAAAPPTTPDLASLRDRLRGKRIGVDVREIRAGCMTGIARYVRNFVRDAPRLVPETAFRLYGNADTDVVETPSNVSARTIRSPLTRTWDQVALPRALSTDDVDVFLSPYDKGPVFSPAPVVLTVHDLLFLRIQGGARLARLAYRALYRAERSLIFTAARAIITDSHHAQNDICTRFPVPPRKVHPIPIGISEAFGPDVSRAHRTRARACVGTDRPYILYVGNFKPHKNVDALVRAFAGLPAPVRQDRMLALCGPPGAARDSTLALAAHLGVGDAVVPVDYVEEALLPGLYAEAELFAFPSLYEGFGLPPLEAMACGTPVVSSGATSLAEVLGEAALIVDARDVCGFAESMRRALTDPDLRHRLRSAGLERARSFTPEVAAAGILGVLASAIDG